MKKNLNMKIFNNNLNNNSKTVALRKKIGDKLTTVTSE